MNKISYSIKKRAKSFFWASIFFNRIERKNIDILYSFCRYIDDIGDNHIFSKKEKRKKLLLIIKLNPLHCFIFFSSAAESKKAAFNQKKRPFFGFSRKDKGELCTNSFKLVERMLQDRKNFAVLRNISYRFFVLLNIIYLCNIYSILRVVNFVLVVDLDTSCRGARLTPPGVVGVMLRTLAE